MTIDIPGFVSEGQPVSAEAIDRFRSLVPDDVVSMWEQYGQGTFLDGFFRIVDPVAATEQLRSAMQVPEQAVVVFTTGMGDVILFDRDVFLNLQFRWGIIDDFSFVPDVQGLIAAFHNEKVLDGILELQPYPEAAARDGAPKLDECFGFAPLLALGGPNSADHLHLGDMWVHINLIMSMVGPPKFLPAPE